MSDQSLNETGLEEVTQQVLTGFEDEMSNEEDLFEDKETEVFVVDPLCLTPHEQWVMLGGNMEKPFTGETLKVWKIGIVNDFIFKL